MEIIDKRDKEIHTVGELEGGTVFELIKNDIPFYFIRTLHEQVNEINTQKYDICCIDIETGNYRYFDSETEILPVKAEVIIT